MDQDNRGEERRSEEADATARLATHDRRVLETIRDHGWCAVHIRPRPAPEPSAAAEPGPAPDLQPAPEAPTVSRIAGSAPTVNGVVPGYAYSIGFGLTSDWAEAAIFGLSLVQSRAALHRFWTNGVSPETLLRESGGDAVLHGVLPDRPVMIRPVSARRYDAYFATALRAYTSLAEFGVLRFVQIVYPDDAGRWPWDRRASASFARAQPPLYEPARPQLD